MPRNQLTRHRKGWDNVAARTAAGYEYAQVRHTKSFLGICGGIWGREPKERPSGAKALVHFAAFSAPFDCAQGRLSKSCPDTKRVFDAG
jgi:hypothetical protein